MTEKSSPLDEEIDVNQKPTVKQLVLKVYHAQEEMKEQLDEITKNQAVYQQRLEVIEVRHEKLQKLSQRAMVFLSTISVAVLVGVIVLTIEYWSGLFA